jgi:hypothetical protein
LWAKNKRDIAYSCCNHAAKVEREMLAACKSIAVLEVCSMLSSESPGTLFHAVWRSRPASTPRWLLLCCCTGERGIGCCSLQARHQGVRRSDDASSPSAERAIGIIKQVTLARGERKPCRHKLNGKPYRASVGSRFMHGSR